MTLKSIQRMPPSKPYCERLNQPSMSATALRLRLKSWRLPGSIHVGSYSVVSYGAMLSELRPSLRPAAQNQWTKQLQTCASELACRGASCPSGPFQPLCF